jgi:hypothetical protein
MQAQSYASLSRHVGFACQKWTHLRIIVKLGLEAAHFVSRLAPPCKEPVGAARYCEEGSSNLEEGAHARPTSSPAACQITPNGGQGPAQQSLRLKQAIGAFGRAVLLPGQASS